MPGYSNNKQISFTKKGIVTTSFEDNENSKGAEFEIHRVFEIAKSSSQAFVLDFSALTDKNPYIMPLFFNATTGPIKISTFKADVYSGGTEIDPLNLNSRIGTAAEAVFKYGVTGYQTTMVNAVAGGGFANQPAGDTIEVISSSADDTTQSVTIYGTASAAVSTLRSETLDLTGTDAVTSSHDDWQEILGVELSASCAGTITIREGSGDLAITTITTGNTTAGIAEISEANQPCYNKIPYHDADGVSTANVCLIGTNANDEIISSIDALNGTTEEAHGTVAFNTVTRALLGAVAAGVDVTILTSGAQIGIREYILGATATPNAPRAGSGGSLRVLRPPQNCIFYLIAENQDTVNAAKFELGLSWIEEVI